MSQTQTEEKKSIPVDDEDLEDGEIDDSDEATKDEDVILVANTKAEESPVKNKLLNDNTNKQFNSNENIVTVIDSSSDTAPTPPPTTLNQIKSKKPCPVEDDHASSIENAIAMALKKKGIEPTIPKVLESKLQHNEDKEGEVPGPGQGQSKSSRRRKRKKQREEKEKEKERKEKVIF